MNTHFEHLQEIIPDLTKRKVLDVGSGRGDFLIECKNKGVESEGIETYDTYIALSLEKEPLLKITRGYFEYNTLPPHSFSFINLCEVIEHVLEAEMAIKQIARLLTADGLCYMSVPNRFGIKDQHYHLYFINWLPRFMAGLVVYLTGKRKDYDIESGHQELKYMNYYTYGTIKALCESCGLQVQDIREEKLMKTHGRYGWPLYIYRMLRPWYFDSFHLLLRVV